MTSRVYAEGPASVHFRHPARQVRELEHERAARVHELLLAPDVTPDEAAELFCCLAWAYGPEPAVTTGTDRQLLTRAIEGIVNAGESSLRDLRTAISYSFDMLGGVLDGPAGQIVLGAKEICNPSVLARLLDEAGVNSPDPSAEELDAEQEALDEWFREMEAGLPARPGAQDRNSLGTREPVAPAPAGSRQLAAGAADGGEPGPGGLFTIASGRRRARDAGG